jgi:hypothetical protein
VAITHSVSVLRVTSTANPRSRRRPVRTLGILEMFSLPLSSALLFSIAWQQMVTHGTRSMCPTALLPLLACPILATTSM